MVLGGEASQSSEINGGVAGRAVDGDTDQRYHSGKCTHTKREAGWWRLDFGLTTMVSVVQVTLEQPYAP